MLNKRVVFSLIAASALTFGMNACSNDDKKPEDSKTENPTENPTDQPGVINPTDQPGVINEDGTDVFGFKACEGSECDTAKTSAKTLLAACDFQKAFEQVDAVYQQQVKENQIDAETALTRSILGIVQFAYNPKVQALLPKLGFKSNTTDFKPLWKDGKVFEEVSNATHNYDDAYDLLPLKIVENDELDWEDTIDRDLTFEQMIDVLVDYKLQFEDLAVSLEKASGAAQGAVKIQDAGCSLDQFEFDASDLNIFAAALHSISLGIDLAAKFDFNFSLYDTIKLSNDAWETLDYEDGESIVNQQACTARTQFASMMDEHFFKKTQSTRTVKGTTARDEFTKMANLIKSAMSANNSGKFFHYNDLNQGAKSDIIDIANKVASGSTVDLSKYIQPELKIDLDKAFKNVPFREYQIKPVDCRYDYSDTENMMDYLYSVYPNYVTGQSDFVSVSIEKDDCETDRYCEFYVDYEFKESLDATFSTGWDFDNFWDDFFNPHSYFGSFEEEE